MTGVRRVGGGAGVRRPGSSRARSPARCSARSCPSRFGLRVGVALGIATFLAAWSVLMGLRVRRQGIDVEALKARFIPQTTIDTTKESIEWAKARVQREPKS